MEAQYLQFIITGLLGLAAFFLKKTLDDTQAQIKELKVQHLATQLELQTVKQQYLHRDDFREFKQELRGMFEALREDLRVMQSNNCPINTPHKN